jgi:dynein intermediate chain 1
MSRNSQERHVVKLTEAELDTEVPPRVLTVADPRAAHNKTIYSFKDKCFMTSEEVRPLIVHLDLKGTLVHKKNAGENEELHYLVDTSKSVGRNQFCFIEKSSQTTNPVICTTGASTRPPPSRDYNMSITQAGIIQRYVSGEREGDEESVEAQDVLYSEEMKTTVKLMERMVNLNQDLEAYQDFRFYIDDSDSFRQTGSLLPLWRFNSDKAKKKQVTCLRWDPQYSDLFAVSYGSYEFLKQSLGGAVIIYSLKNPKFPEKIVITETTSACSLDWNPHRPAILAVGLYDGSVGVVDIRNRSKTLIFSTDRDDDKHSDPVWEVKWVNEKSFVSVSVDGRICTWSLTKSKLESETLSEIKETSPQETEPISGNLNGLCIDFSPHEEGTYLVGTQEGHIYKYSRAVSSSPLDVYRGHSMAVYSVKWNPSDSSVFLSSSSDWTVKLWSTQRHSAPLCSFDLMQAVGDVDWSPIASTIFAAVTADGTLVVFDLAVNRNKPIASQKVIAKGKLTRVQFNAKEPVILAGDDRGSTHCLKLSPNLNKTKDISIQTVVHNLTE